MTQASLDATIQEHKNEFSNRKKRLRKADRYNTASETLSYGNIAQRADLLGLYGQVNKRIRWMPRQ